MGPGRPLTYTQEVADLICEGLSEGKSLREVCRQEGMPPESTVRLWALSDEQGFAAQYARAREIGYHAMADEILEISDNGQNDWMERNGEDGAGWQANGEHLQRSRLRVDTRKWMLSKALPKIYGDKVTTEVSGPDGGPVQTETINRDADEFTRAVVRLASAAGAGKATGEPDAGTEGGA